MKIIWKKNFAFLLFRTLFSTRPSPLLGFFIDSNHFFFFWEIQFFLLLIHLLLLLLSIVSIISIISKFVDQRDRTLNQKNLFRFDSWITIRILGPLNIHQPFFGSIGVKKSFLEILFPYNLRSECNERMHPIRLVASQPKIISYFSLIWDTFFLRSRLSCVTIHSNSYDVRCLHIYSFVECWFVRWSFLIVSSSSTDSLETRSN